MALYGYVDYDPDYKVAADLYAANTKNNYAWTTPDFAAFYITLYPDAESAPLADIAKGSSWFDFVKGNIIAKADKTRMLAQVSASTTDQQALALVKSVKKDVRSFFTSIKSNSATT